MREIPLTQGKVALVDDQNFDFLNQWKWYAGKGTGTWYARRNRRVSEGPGVGTVLMHRAIMRYPGALDVDHRDGNGLNNTLDNLQTLTRAANTLRGNGACAIHARKTHCINGHEYSGYNVMHKKYGRDCRACHNERINKKRQDPTVKAARAAKERERQRKKREARING